MRAVVTVAIGDEFGRLAALSHPLMGNYARRVGADFISLQGESPSPYLAKFRLHDLFTVYERIIFIDTDAIVRPDCPDLFDVVAPEAFGAWLASTLTSRFAPAIIRIQQALGDLGWRDPYFNSGVLITSRQHRAAFDPYIEYTDEYPDQTLLNYRVRKHGFRLQDIGFRLNHTPVANQVADRFASHIIHYAGCGQQREAMMREDLARLGLLGAR